jgi:hypothetical protein
MDITLQIIVMVHFICFIQCNILILYFGMICSIFLDVDPTRGVSLYFHGIYTMFHIVVIPKWDSELEFGQRFTPFLWLSRVQFFRLVINKVIFPYHCGILSSTCVSNLNFEFIWDYIKLEITLIHFQLVIHKVVFLYYCEIYTMSYIVTILNVRIQFWILSYKVYSMLMIAFEIVPIMLRIYAGVHVCWIRIENLLLEFKFIEFA